MLHKKEKLTDISHIFVPSFMNTTDSDSKQSSSMTIVKKIISKRYRRQKMYTNIVAVGLELVNLLNLNNIPLILARTGWCLKHLLGSSYLQSLLYFCLKNQQYSFPLHHFPPEFPFCLYPPVFPLLFLSSFHNFFAPVRQG